MCCCGSFGGPPYGIPIEEETHNLYSDELKAAWFLFDDWFKKAQDEADGDLIDRSSMPEDVKSAMELILETPIPGFEGGFTGKDSCYMIGVESQLTDSE
jgi:hypothetical protein